MMRRRDLITAGSAAFVTGTTRAQAAPLPTARKPIGTTADVRDFGATGDGLTDDWQAIESAGAYLEQFGGGRMYFPSGRYRLANFGKNITVRSNIEYFGDGHSSVIMGSNAAFISPDNAAFGRSAYGNYQYFGIGDVVAGDRFLTFKSAVDATRFKPGDIVIARSADAIVTPGDVLPYYVEMNRVTNTSEGRIELEDAIDDGWKGVMAANVTTEVAQGYVIHDLRIECDNGYPFFIQGSYKSFIHNCWTRGLAVACCNAYTRSMAHDIIATVLWRPGGTSASLFEIETGSVRANFHDIDVYLQGSAHAPARYPLFYCQEFSRRTSLRNIRIAAAETDLGTVFEIMSGQHRIENIEVTAKSVDKVLDYWVREPSRYQLGHLGLSMSNVAIETLDATNGFNHGFVLHNDAPGGEVRNVAIRDCTVNGQTNSGEHNLIWLYQGQQTNITFDGVSGAGQIAMNSAAAPKPAAGAADPVTASPRQSNVVLRNCEFTRVASQQALDAISYVSCRRISSDLPAIVQAAPMTSWSNAEPSAQLTMPIPATAPICRGDRIEIRLSAWYAAHPYRAQIRVLLMGTDILTLQMAPFLLQSLDLDLTLTFAGSSFAAPDHITIDGSARINNIPTGNWTTPVKALNRHGGNAVELVSAINKPDGQPAAIDIKRATIAFRPAENDR